MKFNKYFNELIQEMNGFDKADQSIENIEDLLKGISNYYNGLVYQHQQNPNDMGIVNNLNNLSDTLTKQLNWARNFSAPEDSTYYSG